MKEWKWSLVLLPTISVQSAMPTFTFLAKPIALTANCIMLVWQHASGTSCCKCPLCRRPITLLIPTEHSLSQRHDPEVAQILSKIHAYNRVFGGQPSSFFQRVQDLPFLLHRLLREFLNPQRSLPLVIRARVFVAMIASVVYILSPIDLIPEAILGIVGLLDDVLIGLICFLHVAALYRSVLYLRHAGS
ncbi:uncharacterized protein HKW66_Vig0209570 [Vigna angularis]|uniref:DUF1232 domain-containing protein n=2 Tax=Phaseolus angularis TaxID=3914 RepID=A0A8T0JIT7_PHAAN|nr:uncharacterized protein HKW66_Vig0209570 [Vigna angularis]